MEKYGYNKALRPKLRNWGYKPPVIPHTYPFQSNGWFNYMRDNAPQLGMNSYLPEKQHT
jgi:hypothetical protein